MPGFVTVTEKFIKLSVMLMTSTMMIEISKKIKNTLINISWRGAGKSDTKKKLRLKSQTMSPTEAVVFL